MANSDYELRGKVFGFCPYAYLFGDIDALQNSVVIYGYSSSFPNGIRVNRAAMIGSGPDAEIVVIEEVVGSLLTIGRGCCDTVPRNHPFGTTIWFFDDSIARDETEHTATDTIGIKVIPRTTSGGPVPIAGSPAVELVFNSRFARPYPPGNVLINGNPITSVHTLSDSLTPLALSWAHRDRIIQADALIKHEVASVGPEAGTTYVVEVLDSVGDVVRTESGITGTTWSYSTATARTDFGATTGVLNGSIRLKSVRDGLDSWQSYVIPLVLNFDISPVSKDQSLAWDVRASVTEDQALIWNIE